MSSVKLTTTLRKTEQKGFAQIDANKIPASANAFRSKALLAYQSAALPTTSMEAWRRTDLRNLPADLFRVFTDADPRSPAVPVEILQPVVDDHFGGQLVVTPHGTERTVGADLESQGVIFCDLRTAEQNYPELVAKILGTLVSPEESVFAAMSASFAQNGAFIYIPQGVHVKQPLHSIFWGAGDGLAFINNILVYLEEGSSLTYVHESASPKESADRVMVATNVEIHVGENADLRFVELQSLGSNVWNFSHERSRVDSNGKLDWIFGAVGSKLTKNFSDLDLAGEGAWGRMSGFYMTDKNQHLDHDTQQNHFAAHTTSDLLFKGALLDSSRSVWQGMIYVAPDAQQTDGYQANRNLILSDKARADSIPGLEILADDVRCTHGATVGKLEQEPIFYLKSRGIPQKEAERIVVEGFFDPIMQRIPFEGVRQRFQDAILQKMKN